MSFPVFCSPIHDAIQAGDPVKVKALFKKILDWFPAKIMPVLRLYAMLW
jgi:hypothetical protein